MWHIKSEEASPNKLLEVCAMLTTRLEDGWNDFKKHTKTNEKKSASHIIQIVLFFDTRFRWKKKTFEQTSEKAKTSGNAVRERRLGVKTTHVLLMAFPARTGSWYSVGYHRKFFDRQNRSLCTRKFLQSAKAFALKLNYRRSSDEEIIAALPDKKIAKFKSCSRKLSK